MTYNFIVLITVELNNFGYHKIQCWWLIYVVFKGWDEGWNYWGQSGDDNKKYATLQYANGPGYYFHRTADGTLDTEQPRINQTLDMMGKKQTMRMTYVLYYVPILNN